MSFAVRPSKKETPAVPKGQTQSPDPADWRPDQGYNERLFSSRGLRSYYHLARFKWTAEQFRKLGLSDVRLVEIGCFDGRLVDEVQSAVSEYVGLDANWEGGLDLARSKFQGRPGITLIEAQDPTPLHKYPDGHFTAAAALETLEHLPPDMVGEYLDQLARITKGYLFVTVPNELGPIFLLKHSAKALLYRDSRPQPYTWTELAAATLRRSDLVARDEHKGFDYRKLIEEIARRFEIRSVKGIPSFGLPPSLSATVAIVASNA